MTTKKVSMPGIGLLLLLLDGLWLSEKALSAQMRNSHLNYVCIFTHKITCIRDNWRKLGQRKRGPDLLCIISSYWSCLVGTLG